MTHVDDDTLLKFVLEILDNPDESLVRDHLSMCTECRQKSANFQHDVAALGTVEFLHDRVAQPRMPRTTRGRLSALTAAAVLVAGFLGGYVTSELSNPDRVVVVQQHVQPTPVVVPVTQYVSCEQIDISH